MNDQIGCISAKRVFDAIEQFLHQVYATIASDSGLEKAETYISNSGLTHQYLVECHGEEFAIRELTKHYQHVAFSGQPLFDVDADLGIRNIYKTVHFCALVVWSSRRRRYLASHSVFMSCVTEKVS